MQINVSSDLKSVSKYLNDTKKRQIPKAASRALNRTVDQTKTQVVRDLVKVVGEESGLGSAGLRKAIATNRSTVSKLYAELIPSGRAIPLIKYKSRQVKAGVSHNAWGRRQVATSAFIARMPSGHKGVYRRTGQAKRLTTRGRYAGTGIKREPIKQLWGPSLPKEFIKANILQGMRTHAGRLWPGIFARELKYYLSRA